MSTYSKSPAWQKPDDLSQKAQATPSRRRVARRAGLACLIVAALIAASVAVAVVLGRRDGGSVGGGCGGAADQGSGSEVQVPPRRAAVPELQALNALPRIVASTSSTLQLTNGVVTWHFDKSQWDLATLWRRAAVLLTQRFDVTDLFESVPDELGIFDNDKLSADEEAAAATATKAAVGSTGGRRLAGYEAPTFWGVGYIRPPFNGKCSGSREGGGSDYEQRIVAHHAMRTVRVITGTGGRCTGSLVGRNLVLTNAHCFLKDGTGRIPDEKMGEKVQAGVADNSFERESRISEYMCTARYDPENKQKAEQERIYGDRWHQDYLVLVLTEPLGNRNGYLDYNGALTKDDYTESGYANRLSGGLVAWQTIVGFPRETTLRAYSKSKYWVDCAHTPCYQSQRMGWPGCRLGGWVNGNGGLSVSHPCDVYAPGSSGSAFVAVLQEPGKMGVADHCPELGLLSQLRQLGRGGTRVQICVAAGQGAQGAVRGGLQPGWRPRRHPPAGGESWQVCFGACILAGLPRARATTWNCDVCGACCPLCVRSLGMQRGIH